MVMVMIVVVVVVVVVTDTTIIHIRKSGDSAIYLLCGFHV